MSLFFKYINKWLVGLNINSTIFCGTWQQALPSNGLIHLVIDLLIVIGVMSQSKPNGSHHWHKVQGEHAIDIGLVERCDHDDEFIFLSCHLAQIIDDGDMAWKRALQVLCALITHLEK